MPNDRNRFRSLGGDVANKHHDDYDDDNAHGEIPIKTNELTRIHETHQGPLHRKLKKGERKKAAAAAAAAAVAAATVATEVNRCGVSGSDSIGCPSVEHRHSNTVPSEGGSSSHAAPSVVSSRVSDTFDDRRREVSAASETGWRRQRRRPKTARQHHRAPARSKLDSARRHNRGSKVYQSVRRCTPGLEDSKTFSSSNYSG